MKTCSVRLHLDPAYEALRSFVRQLPETFDRRGETLFAGRNTIRAFDVGGVRIAVKRFKRPGPFQAFVIPGYGRARPAGPMSTPCGCVRRASTRPRRWPGANAAAGERSRRAT